MKKKSFLFILIFISGFSIYAQIFPSDKGYVVNFAGDTLKGSINIINSSWIKFKPKDKPEYIALNPNETKVVVQGII